MATAEPVEETMHLSDDAEQRVAAVGELLIRAAAIIGAMSCAERAQLPQGHGPLLIC